MQNENKILISLLHVKMFVNQKILECGPKLVQIVK